MTSPFNLTIPNIPNNVATEPEVVAAIAMGIMSFIGTLIVVGVLFLFKGGRIWRVLKKVLGRGNSATATTTTRLDSDQKLQQVVNNTIHIGSKLDNLETSIKEMAESMTSSLRPSERTHEPDIEPAVKESASSLSDTF